MFRDYVLPLLGNVHVSDITTSHVLDVLTPIWVEKYGTAPKVRQRISAVMDWAHYLKGYGYLLKGYGYLIDLSIIPHWRIVVQCVRCLCYQ